MSGAAEGKRPAPVEPEEGGGAAKRQKQRRDGGVATKPGNGAPEKEHTNMNKRDGGKDTQEGGGAAAALEVSAPAQKEQMQGVRGLEHLPPPARKE